MCPNTLRNYAMAPTACASITEIKYIKNIKNKNKKTIYQNQVHNSKLKHCVPKLLYETTQWPPWRAHRSYFPGETSRRDNEANRQKWFPCLTAVSPKSQRAHKSFVVRMQTPLIGLVWPLVKSLCAICEFLALVS